VALLQMGVLKAMGEDWDINLEVELIKSRDEGDAHEVGPGAGGVGL
jgi:hypothetical protein